MQATACMGRSERQVRSILVLVLALLTTAPAWADEQYDRCIGQSDGTNQEWAVCGGEWIGREDARLNEAWRRLLADVSERTEADLRTEQRAWIAYKDLSCLFHANGDRGREGQVLGFPACRAGVIASRTAELDAYAEGDRPE